MKKRYGDLRGGELFRWCGVWALASEYSSNKRGGLLFSYIVGTGETFCGGCTDDEVLAELEVDVWTGDICAFLDGSAPRACSPTPRRSLSRSERTACERILELASELKALEEK